jgi:cob(I)alamin adenosyltransferase
MSKIYTRFGDAGETRLLGGARVSKSHVRVEACGAVDELCTVLGLCRTEPLDEEVDHVLRRIQGELYWMAAELAAPHAEKYGVQKLDEANIVQMEQDIDQFDLSLPPLCHFVMPGGTRAAALLHVARTVCRRAERGVVRLREQEPEVRQLLIAYLNRLGDLLFVLARAVNFRRGLDEELWPGVDGPSSA